MRKKFLVFAMLVTASVYFTACEPAGNTNTANRPANAANTSNTANMNTAASSAAIEADIRKMTADIAAALAKNDADALEKFYADNYMLVNLDGSVQNRADRMASFRSGATKFDSFAYDDISIRTNPEGTGAVVTSRANAKGTSNGQPTEGPIRVTHVWSKTKDGWKMVHGHATRITGGAGSTAANTAPTGNATNMAPATNANR